MTQRVGRVIALLFHDGCHRVTNQLQLMMMMIIIITIIIIIIIIRRGEWSQQHAPAVLYPGINTVPIV